MGLLDVVSSAVSLAGSALPVGKSLELDAGPLKVSISADKSVTVEVDGQEVAQASASASASASTSSGLSVSSASSVTTSGSPSCSDSAAPSVDLHSDGFDPPKPPAPVALFDVKSGDGSKPGGVGDGRK